MDGMKVCIVVGTRPEIVKMSPIIKELVKQRLNHFVLHTGQHYSYNMDGIFFKELGLKKPKYNLKIGSGTQGDQTGRMLVKIEQVLMKEKPDVVLVQGDTNTVLAASLAAGKLHIRIGHVEAGIRSFNRYMPEELNRILVDHISDYLFAPTKNARRQLIKEGIDPKKILVTGNTVVDAVLNNIKIAKRRASALRELGLVRKNYMLLTMHRQENVDNKKRLSSILKGITLLHKNVKMPIVFPAHPRTLKMISRLRLKLPECIKTIEPVGYIEFLQLEANASLILTDSGGLQEEACILKVPCITLRDDTERPETIEVGSNALVGTNPKLINKFGTKMLRKNTDWGMPFGDGKAGIRIIKAICHDF
jgi:UDP-N-acetylglucosamine 2-epimerase (non-hydrolysing)